MFARLMKVTLPMLLALSSGLWALPAYAAWPERPVTLVVPYPAGGLTDNVARALADEVGKQLGQTVVVENRSGAGGKIGFDSVRRAPKDGYTIGLVVPALMVLLPLTNKDFAIEPLNEFDPITNGVENYYVLIVNKSMGVNTLPEFVQQLKEKRGNINFGVPGIGTTFHFNVARMINLLGLPPDSATVISYKGEIDAIRALMAGDLDFMVATDTARLALDGGRAVPIAVASASRVEKLPDVPTFRELGVDFVTDGWVGFVAPKGTPKPVIDKLNHAFVKALQAEPVRKRMAEMAYVPIGDAPDAFRARVEENRKMYSKMLEDKTIVLDMN